MKKWEILQSGKWMITGEGGNSMLPILKSGQKVVLKPMPSLDELKVGDIVYSTWRHVADFNNIENDKA